MNTIGDNLMRKTLIAYDNILDQISEYYIVNA